MSRGVLPIFSHPAYDAALPEGHRVPMRKYGRLAAVLREPALPRNVPDERCPPAWFDTCQRWKQCSISGALEIAAAEHFGKADRDSRSGASALS